MLEKIFKSKKPSLAELLRDTGTTYTVHFPSRTFTALEVDDGVITFVDQAPSVGQTYSGATGEIVIVTAVSPGSEEGAALITTEPMSHSVSIHKAIAVGKTLDGRDRFRLSPTNWRHVPAQKDELTFRLPAPYQPDRGELIYCGSSYFQIISTTLQGPFCVCQTQEFPV
mgnify:CR=1 FL=1